MRRTACSVSAGWWPRGPRAVHEGLQGALPHIPSGTPRRDPTLLASSSSPRPETDGEGGVPEEITLVKTPASSHWRSSLLGTDSDPHPCARVPLSHCQN